MRFIDIFLDALKKSLVRFRKAKFGLLFIINVFKIPDFMLDRRANLISKIKLVSSLAIAILYLIVGIDFIPEMITGVFGFIDDIFVTVWSLGIVNEEIEKYKKMIKNDKNPKVVEGVKFSIKDEDE